MSTNELTLTLVGWVATEPKIYTGIGTTPFTSFRMASTRRYFDRAAGAWVDGRTEWFTIKAWRQQAHNVAASLRKSDPVIVQGRLVTEEWTGPDGPRTTLVLEAAAIGPDLSFGQAQFARVVHVGAGGQRDVADDEPDEGAGGPNGPQVPDDVVGGLDPADDELTDDLAGVP
jgi:single-strand DNA-binding protein